jgi:1,4-dihydroxy-2-naphthoate octaprenyltransferase
VGISFFLSVSALAPYGLGALLARSSGFALSRPVWWCGLAAGGCLVLAAFASRKGYCAAADEESSPGPLPPAFWKRLAAGAVALAMGLGLLLQFVWGTGLLTLPLEALAVWGGYFLFAPPLAWQRRGWGEIWGSLCLGLMPVFTGYYLQSPHLVSEIVLYGLPLTLAGFNALLVLGFPNPGGKSPPSRGLASRLGPVPGALVFTLVNILILAALVFCILFPATPLRGGTWLWALVGVGVVNQELIKRRAYYHPFRLKVVQYLTLAQLLGMNFLFAMGLWGRL